MRDELHETVLKDLPVDRERLGIFGHALRNADIYRSMTAFTPIAAPMAVRGARRRSAAI